MASVEVFTPQFTEKQRTCAPEIEPAEVCRWKPAHRRAFTSCTAAAASVEPDGR